MMKNDETKIEWMEMYENFDDLSFRYFPVLYHFSQDKNPIIRSQATSLIATFINGKAKDLLFSLARDENRMVRNTSYISLHQFIYEDVEMFLKEAIAKEKDGKCRSQIISSWADVVFALNHITEDHIDFLLKHKSKEQDEDCLLSCCYAQYLFGDISTLVEIFGFLRHEYSQMRSRALIVLGNIENEENEDIIKNAVTFLMENEDDTEVIDEARGLLDDIEQLSKLNQLIEFDQLENAPDEYLPKFKILSYNKDSFIRSEVAKFIINYVNEEGKEILLQLAQDEDVSVRIEAYDSLSYFHYEEVEKFLQVVIQIESDNLAQSFAIDSWAKVVASLEHISKDKFVLLEKIRANGNNDYCLLSCYSAQYVFGDDHMLDFILHYLRHEDLHLRCAALNQLKDIINKDNMYRIKEAITAVLKCERYAEVREEAIGALEDISYDDIEVFLKYEILEEKDDLIRSYIISSWAEVAVSLDHDSEENTIFIEKQKNQEKSNITLLSCCYAQYILGNEQAFTELLSYLQHENMTVRRATLDILGSLANGENKQEILKSLRSLLDVEETVEINDLARDLLLTVNYITG